MTDLQEEKKRVSSYQISSRVERYTFQQLDEVLTAYKTSIPLVQRPLNSPWVEKLARDYLMDLVKSKVVTQPDVIHLCVYQEEKQAFLLDGQHRMAAYKYICDLSSDGDRVANFRRVLNDHTILEISINDLMERLHKTDIDVKIHFPTDVSHISFLFERINARLKVEMGLTSEQDLIRGGINLLRNKFPKSDCTSASRPRHKVDWGQVEAKLRQSKLLEMYNIATPEKLFTLLDYVNTCFLGLNATEAKQENFFTSFPNATRTKKYRDHWDSCVRAKLMLGIYPNYEWIDELTGAAKHRITACFNHNHTNVKAFFGKALV